MSYTRAGYEKKDPIAFKTLIANDDDITTRKVTIPAGTVLAAGSVIGKVTATGKYVLSTSAANDGSQTPDYVLAQDTDASAGDLEAIAYETVTVVKTGLVIGAGHTLASIREGLRLKGIKIDD